MGVRVVNSIVYNDTIFLTGCLLSNKVVVVNRFATVRCLDRKPVHRNKKNELSEAH